MHDLPITTVTAALLAVIFIVLSIRVGAARGKSKASLGDGSGGLIPAGQEHTVPLLVACRSHANFAEYVPLALILLGLAEHNGAPRILLLVVATALVLARILHPIGMGSKVPNPYRAGGALLTILAIATCAVTLLVRSA
jgi:uncharacterized protein